jgi:hypothetical protein
MLPQYLLESSICLALFYTFYHWALRRQTFFQLNRWYLLLTPLLALLIPLAEWEWTAPEPSPVVEYVLPVWTEWRAVDYSVQATMAQPAPGMQVQLNDLLLAVYAAGVFFLLLQLLRRLLNVYRLIWRGSKRYKADYILIETPEEIPAASFFSYVFWRGTDSELDEVVLAHESVHVRQRHSLDVILMECMVMLLWFNPLIYLFRNQLRETHEYIADAYVSRRLGSAHQYARHLLAQGHPTVTYSLTHSFAAMLPKRLKMLGRPRSAFWRYFNYLFVIPMIGIMIILFAYNFSGKLSPELADRLEDAQSKLNRLGNTAIYAEDQQAVAMQLDWSGERCDCYPGQFPTFYYCENVYLSVGQFKRLIDDDHWFSLSENGKEVKYEIKTMTSKRQLKKGRGFLDMTTINQQADFWKDLSGGDVLYVVAQLESGKWTEFNVLLNPKGKLAFPFYDVYIGDLRIPIEINNMTASRHVDKATFESFRREKIRLLKNGKEWTSFWLGTRIPGENEAKERDWKTEVPAADFMPDAKILNMPQNQMRLALNMENGERVTINVLAAQGPFREDGGQREVTIRWGDLELVYEGGIFMQCTNFWKERLQQPLRIFVNGQERMIEDFGYMSVANRGDSRTYFYKGKGNKTPLKSMKDLNRRVLDAFEEKNWDQNLVVILGDLKTTEGEQFSLILNASGVRDCQTDIAEFISKYRSFRSSSGFVLHYDFSNSGLEPFLWDSLIKNQRLFHNEGAQSAAYFVNEKWLSDEELDRIDPSTIQSLTLLKPTYGKQKFGEQGANGVVVLKTD